MEETRHLRLPYIAAAQAQKHVTHNEALDRIDALLQLNVLDSGIAAPPESPAEGDRYIVATGATGAWSGKDGSVAAFVAGAWTFFEPVPGWIAFDVAAGALLIRAVEAWETAGSLLGPVARFGVNASADDTNRLAVRSEAVLLSGIEDEDGGTGDIRLTVSKETEPDTASLLFQSGFSGRAEIGLVGDNDLLIKVSEDGTNWVEAVRIDAVDGVPRIRYDNAASGLTATTLADAIDEIATGIRETLTADRTYYVRVDGSDGNDGLADTSGGAFATPQKAWDIILGLDLGGNTVTIRIGDGTYVAGLTVTKPAIGGAVVVQGNAGTPGNVVLSRAGAHAISIAGQGHYLTVRDLKVETNVSGAGIHADKGAAVTLANVDFGTCVQAHLAAENGAQITYNNSSCSISGGATSFAAAYNGAQIGFRANGVTLLGAPHFSVAFAMGMINASIFIDLNSFAGSATGARYSASLNAVINTGGAGATHLPGNVGGSVSTGGQYA